MITQDVSALPTFNPHGGPITHSSTGSKPDSPAPPCSQGCSSCVASYVIHEPPSKGSSNLLLDAILIPDCFEPLSRPVSGIERSPACSKLPLKPHYFALDIFLSIIRELLFATFLVVVYQIIYPAEIHSSVYPLNLSLVR